MFGFMTLAAGLANLSVGNPLIASLCFVAAITFFLIDGNDD
jgi:hypothetical protein